ncbi:MAG: hypothetical protein ACYDA8_12165 [Deferrisomatales bacterium]
MRVTMALTIAALLAGLGTPAGSQEVVGEASSPSGVSFRPERAEGDGSDNSTSVKSSVLGNEMRAEDDVEIEANSTDATSGSASASDRSYAHVDSSRETFLRESSLSNNELKGEVSNNLVNLDGYFNGRNELRGHAFSETKGVNQVAQNAGVNGLIQQVFSINMHDANIRLEERAPASAGQ